MLATIRARAIVTMLADRAFPICVLRSVIMPAIVSSRTDDSTKDGSACRGLRDFNADGDDGD